MVADAVGVAVEATTRSSQAMNSKPLPPARQIPETFMSSVKSWWATGEKGAAAAEERLLRMLPFYESDTWTRQSNETAVVGRSSRAELTPRKRYLNVFSITPTDTRPTPSQSSASPPPVLLLHGYGAGLGFFFRNFPALGQWVASTGSPLHALDWLGMGRSARVPFRVRAPRADARARVAQAESFFVDALEEWREKQGLQRVTLVGHSLGAYLATAYALRHPNRVAKLVLLSPAGVLGAPESADPAREVSDDQRSVTGMEGDTAGLATAVGVADRSTVSLPEPRNSERVKAAHEEQREKKEREPLSRRVLTHLWEEGWSPFQIVRSMSVFGPMIVGKYSSRRFSGLTEEETRNMNDYILNITLAKGSGEYCISHILAPFAHARYPLVDRISELKIPVVFVYGEHDWMDPEGGVQCVERLKAAGNNNARFYIIDKAGHHVYLDNPRAVDKLLIKELSSED